MYKLYMELKEEENLLQSTKYDFLYPNLNDRNFNIKIAEKKEFNDTEYNGEIHDVKIHGDKLCNANFELSNHQIFVRNFLSNQTPYNGLLLYHGLGTGKTCSAITISEEYREYMKQMGLTKRIIIVGNKNIQDNYKLQLFDERKLEKINGYWKLSGCTGSKLITEINPINMKKNMTKDKLISQVNNIINSSYLFLGYREFGNMIAKKINKFANEPDLKIKQKNIETALNNEYSNRLVIIDEVQNIRLTDNIEDKKVGQRLLDLTGYVNNLKLILLSATPMFNTYKEIVWLLNLLNKNDNRSIINIKDIFDKNGNFIKDVNGNEIGHELLIRKSRGYVSFIRGDNPYTFPYRIYPAYFDPQNSIKNMSYPRIQINGIPILQGISHVDVYTVGIGSYQKTVYDEITKKLRKNYKDINESNLDKGFGYQDLEAPLQILNMTYPNLDETTSDIKDLYGNNGLKNVMNIKKPQAEFEYKYDDLKIFQKDIIGNYGAKIKNICDSIMISEGIVLVYSQYIDGGIVPIALALEELGFTRFGRENLFSKPPSELIDAITMKPKSSVETNFKPAKYCVISGDIVLSPNNSKEIKKITDSNNLYGEGVKVVLISRAGSEGIDLKNVRQIHIIDPWYNMNRIEQIIGRGVRTCSHKDLEFIRRNVMIFLYATYINDRVETLDLYLYRLAEIKALKIGKVSRVLKKNAIDCLLNKQQTNFTTENMNQIVEQQLSNGLSIEWEVGDKPYSSLCDYMDTCSYNCDPNKEKLEINYATYNESFVSLNIEKLIEKIKDIFKEQYVCEKEELIRKINYVKEYPLVQIYSALDKILNDDTEILTDMFGKKGYLVNVSTYYFFQPVELKNENITIHERIKPIDYKHEKINITLPKKKTATIIEHNIESLTGEYEEQEQEQERERNDNIDVMRLIGKLNDNFITATSGDLPSSTRGLKNWYDVCRITIDRMVNETIENEIVEMKILEYFVLEHIMETLNFEETFKILQYITQKSTFSEFEDLINKYFKDRIIKNNDTVAIALLNEKPEMYVLKDKSWKKPQPQDAIDLKETINNQLEIPKERLGNTIGFIDYFKKKEFIFKTIDTDNVKKGSRCDQTGKNATLNVLNKIVGYEKYTKENTNGLNVATMCVEQEFYLRFFNYIKKDGYYWFLRKEQIFNTKM